MRRGDDEPIVVNPSAAEVDICSGPNGRHEWEGARHCGFLSAHNSSLQRRKMSRKAKDRRAARKETQEYYRPHG